MLTQPTILPTKGTPLRVPGALGHPCDIFMVVLQLHLHLCLVPGVLAREPARVVVSAWDAGEGGPCPIEELALRTALGHLRLLEGGAPTSTDGLEASVWC